MMNLKSFVTAAAAALALCQGVGAGVSRRWGTPAGPFCTDFTPFVYAGCFSDPSSPRALPFSSDINTQNMTAELCVSFCKGNNYRYAGLEYYGECFCGASVAGPQIDESNCNFPCTGNQSEACGGNNILSVYQDPTFPADNTSTISDYQASGCWTDSSSSGRTLIYMQNNLSPDNMTVEECLFSCKDSGYPLAGVEYASQCFCGVVLGNGTQQVDSSMCNMPCNGNTNETCGGPALLNLYVATDLESSQPCNSTSSSVSSSSSTTTSITTSTTSTTTTTSTTSTTTSTTTTTTSTTSTTTSTTSTTTSTTSTTTSTTPTTTSITPTTSPTTMITTSSTTTTSSAALCTTTIPPTCEYSCGSWCSKPLPYWSTPSDCQVAAGNCQLQVAACFSNAQFPDSLNCFSFSSWCQSVSSYCGTGSKYGVCSKDDCFSKYPPVGPPVTPSISVYTCPITTTPKPSTTTTKPTTSSTSVPVPTCSNICQQANNPRNGYTSTSPCGGIPLPCFTCNNIKSGYDSGSCLKLYTHSDSSQCPSYSKSSVGQGCQDACEAQYNSCMNVYAQSCKNNNGGGWGNWGNWGNNGDTYSSASQKCQNQHNDCLSVNWGVSAGNRCGSWNYGWY